MRNFVIFVFVLYLCQNATAYCCFRDPYMLPTTPCTNMCNPCNCVVPCDCSVPCNCGLPCNCGVPCNSGLPCNCGVPCNCGLPCNCGIPCDCGVPCNCGIPCKCYRDPANVCNVCDTPSPVCQCMSKCGCDCPKYPIYFPEVEYPVTIMEIDPFYYRTCFCA